MGRVLELWESLTGAVIPFAGAAAPAGFLFCQGQVVTRAAYPNLFAVIGTTYNTTGETAAQFRLPDLRGEFVRGLDAGRGVDTGRTLGSKQKATIVAFDLSPTSNPTVDTLRGTATQMGADPVDFADYPAVTLSYIETGVVANSAPSGTAATRPRNVALNYIIKT